jgi:hypothetical protein
VRLSKRLSRVERATPPAASPVPPSEGEADWPAALGALMAVAGGDDAAADRLRGRTRQVVEDLRPYAGVVRAFCDGGGPPGGGV